MARKCKNTQSYLPLIMQKLHFPLKFVIFFVTSFDDRFNNLCVSVPWWKGYCILILGIYFFTPRNTFFLAKWQEKRDIPFSPHQYRDFPFVQISFKRLIYQKNDCDFRNQHRILDLGIFSNLIFRGFVILKITPNKKNTVLKMAKSNQFVCRTLF